MVDLSTKFKKREVSALIRAIEVISKLKEERAAVAFPRLGDPKNWRLLIFSDAAHANLNDGVSSMGAHLIFLVGENKTFCPLSWHAGKIKRVVRSTIAAEALSLQEAFEDGFYTRQIIEDMMGIPVRTIPLIAYVDNKSVMEALHSTKHVEDKRLRLDIGALRESLQRRDLNAVKWCPGTYQLANCMTKRGASGYMLQGILQSGQLTLDNWVI